MPAFAQSTRTLSTDPPKVLRRRRDFRRQGRVADGTRTHDHLDHNQGLYQLSYSHRAQSQDRFGLGLPINADLHDASAGVAGARHPAPR